MTRKEKDNIVFEIINSVNHLTFEHEFDGKVLLRILSYIPLELSTDYPAIDTLCEQLEKGEKK